METKEKVKEQLKEEKDLAEAKIVKKQDQHTLSDDELEQVSGGESERSVYTGGWDNSPIVPLV